MSSQRLLGLALLVVGGLLLYFGLHATDSVSESVKEGVTGKYTDKTTWYIIGGAVTALIGLLTAFLPSRVRTA
jgi:uncharacterized membrane protein